MFAVDLNPANLLLNTVWIYTIPRAWYVSSFNPFPAYWIHILLQSADPQNIVFALTRNKATSTDLLNLASQRTNVHVLQADITDISALRVRFQFSILCFQTDLGLGCCQSCWGRHWWDFGRSHQQRCLFRSGPCWIYPGGLVRLLSDGVNLSSPIPNRLLPVTVKKTSLMKILETL